MSEFNLPVAPSTKPHPLLLAAAGAVTMLAVAGTARLAGWLPATGTHLIPLTTPAAESPPLAAAPTVRSPTPAPNPRAVRHSATDTGSRNHSRNDFHGSKNQEIAVRPAPTSADISNEHYQRTTPHAPSTCMECGVVQSVTEVAVEAKPSGGGAVVGGILGGIVGNQIGKGATRDIATVLGAVGGAYAGNHLEKSSKEGRRYDVVVRFDDGSTSTFSGEALPAWIAGDRVRLQNGVLTSAAGNSTVGRGTI